MCAAMDMPRKTYLLEQFLHSSLLLKENCLWNGDLTGAPYPLWSEVVYQQKHWWIQEGVFKAIAYDLRAVCRLAKQHQE
jgi:hypothetical protein